MHRTILPLMVLAFTWGAQGCAQSSGVDTIDVQRQTVEKTAPTEVTGNVDLPRFPSISPDGKHIVFSWRGDLWKVSSGGGQAARLTSHPRDDLQSAWTRDGTRLAFVSKRTGYANIHLMNADGTDLRQVTDIDRPCRLAAFGVDEDQREIITFSAYLEGDVHRAHRPYLVYPAGGPITRLHDAFGAHPVVSPDGTRVVFTRGNSRWSRRHYRGPAARDVWLHHRADGSFTPLTEWAGNDGQAKWAGANALLFLSDRELDCVNLYRMDVNEGVGSAERLTAFCQDDVQHFDVSADGTTAVLAVWDTLYTLALDEPDAPPAPLIVSAGEDEADRFELKAIDREVGEAALSPDGQVMAFVAYGELYVRNLEEKSPTVRVTHSTAREKHIAWSPDGLRLYFVSDRDGTESIYTTAVALTREEVKDEFEQALNPPEETPDEEQGDSESEKADEKLKDEAKESAVEEPAAKPDPITEPSPKDNAGDDEEESDDKDQEEDDEEEELPKELNPKRWHDAIKFTIAPVVATASNDRQPSPSPDGRSLAFRRGRGDLMVRDLETGVERPLATGWDTGLHWQWSPDSRHIAYAQSNLNYNTDIWIVPADGSAPAVNITRHPDNDLNPRWSADGRILSFVSERVNEEYDVWMVYLDKNLEVLTPKELEEYYEDAVEAAKKRKPLKIENPKQQAEDEENQDTEDDEKDSKNEVEDKEEKREDEEEADEEEEPLELDLEDAYLRLRRVTTLSGSEGNNALTPGGDRYIFTATVGEHGLFSVKWDGTERKRLADAADVQQVSLTGDKVIFVAKGRVGTVPPAGDKVEYVDLTDKIRIDLEEQSSQKFLEAARALGEVFYHPTMKGLDWPALTEKYHALARRARTADEFNHVANRFVGELNASHLGVYASSPKSPHAQAQGKLGTRHRRVQGGYEVTEVIPESPAAKGKMALEVGDVITAIELELFDPTDTVESRLRGRVDRETLVTIRRSLNEESRELNVLLTPISWGREVDLAYKAWRQRNARLAEEWSAGRIGYIHIQSMGQGSLDVFERDLYAAAGDKEGLIIDVRDNGGGWTTDRLLASIMVREHAYTLPRGGDRSHTGGYPQGRLFIQRYTLPINMLCNENSFSNAEIISHAFKTLERGTLVGQQTHGAVISTSGMSLIDGTHVRLPLRGWFLPDGTDMENHGAVPDLIIPQTPQAESRHDDEQLRAAVEDLLKRLG